MGGTLHGVLTDILEKSVQDEDVRWLLDQIIESFRPGLPLGNLTSQLLVNVYMNEFDHFLKRQLRVKFCVRYADDFVIFHKNKCHLENILPQMSEFLENKLKLFLHPNKVFIKTIASGIDFLGWVHFPTHRVLRTSTKRRIFERVNKNPLDSYKGLLRHGNTYKILQQFPEEKDERE